MNTRPQDIFPRPLTRAADEEPAEGSLLWAADQLRRIARMLEELQGRPPHGEGPLPPVPGTRSVAPAASGPDDGPPDITEPVPFPAAAMPRRLHPAAMPEARHVVQ